MHVHSYRKPPRGETGSHTHIYQHSSGHKDRLTQTQVLDPEATAWINTNEPKLDLYRVSNGSLSHNGYKVPTVLGASSVKVPNQHVSGRRAHVLEDTEHP